MSNRKTAGVAEVEAAYERIRDAIVEHQLLPGTRLKEEELCEALGVGRGTIRKVLAQLSHHNLVNQVPNSGAHVAKPSVQEARQVFQARRLIEAELVRDLAANFTPEKRRLLEAHVEAEHQAHDAGNLSLRIRLSGEFHLLIGELAENPVLTGFLREIVSRASLIVALYQKPSSELGVLAGHRSCSEHLGFINALSARKTEQAVALMIEHLQELENQLDLESAPGSGVDFKKIFSSR